MKRLLRKLIDSITKRMPWASTPDKIDPDAPTRMMPLDELVGGSVPLDRIPNRTYHKFTFADGTTLEFKQINRDSGDGDYWGDWPAAGAGMVVNPDGTSRQVNVNGQIRHARRAHPYPSMVPSINWTRPMKHFSLAGKRLYCDSAWVVLELVVAVELNKANVGITSALVKVEAKQETWL